MRNNRTYASLAVFLAALVPTLQAGREYPAKPGEAVVENQLIVRLKSATNPAAVIPGFLRNAVIHNLNLPDVYLVDVPGGIPPGISNLLSSHGLVEFVEPNRVRQTTGLSNPNDSYYVNSTSSGQWGLFTVQALQAWNLMPGRYLTAANPGTGRVKVAVLDTGADCTHPDFINFGGSSTDAALGGQLMWSGSQALVATTIASPTCIWQDDHGHGTHV